MKSSKSSQSSNGRHRKFVVTESESPELELTLGVYDPHQSNELPPSIVSFLHSNQVHDHRKDIGDQVTNQSISSTTNRSRDSDESEKEALEETVSGADLDEGRPGEKSPELSEDKSTECERPPYAKCLSTLDCDLRRNERCVQQDLEEQQFYARLQQITSNSVLFSPLFTSDELVNGNRSIKGQHTENDDNRHAWLDELAEGRCGCSAPAFARNPKTNRCELLRPLQLSLRMRFEHKMESDFKRDEQVMRTLATVVKASGTLQESLHHFRLLKVFPLRPITATYAGRNNKNRRIKRRLPSTKMTDQEEQEEAGGREPVESQISPESDQHRSTSSTPRIADESKAVLPVFGVAGLLMVYESQYGNDFALQFSNQFCATLNQLRLRSRLQQLLNVNIANERFMLQTHRSPILIVNASSSNLHKRSVVEPMSTSSSWFNLPVDSLPEVNITQIRPHSDVCGLEQAAMLSLLGRPVQSSWPSYVDSGSSLVRLRSTVNLSEADVYLYSRLSYCESDQAVCQNRPSTVYGYTCVCQPGLMDLGAWPSRYPAEHCGVRCPLNYCSNGGFCHVRGASPAGLHVPPELTAQQQYLSTAARAASGPERSGLAAQLAATLLRYARQQQRYYAAIYSVQQRFASLFSALPNGAGSSAVSRAEDWSALSVHHTNTGQSSSATKLKYKQTLRGNLYCTCSGWHIGARCQYSGLLVLCVLLVVVALLTFLLACAFSLLCVSSGSGGNLARLGSLDKLQDIESIESNLVTPVESPPLGTARTQQVDDVQDKKKSKAVTDNEEHYQILPAITKPASANAHMPVKSSVSVPVVTSKDKSSCSPKQIVATTNSCKPTAATNMSKAASASTPIDSSNQRCYATERPLLKSVVTTRSTHPPGSKIPFKSSVAFAPLPVTCSSAPPHTGSGSLTPEVSKIDRGQSDRKTIESGKIAPVDESVSTPDAVSAAVTTAAASSSDWKRNAVSAAQQTDSFDSMTGERQPTRGLRPTKHNAAAQVQFDRIAALEQHLTQTEGGADRNNNLTSCASLRSPSINTPKHNESIGQLSVLDAAMLNHEWIDGKQRSQQYKQTQITWF